MKNLTAQFEHEDVGMESDQPITVALIGFGAIGSSIQDYLRDDNRIRIRQIVVPYAHVTSVQAQVGESVEVVSEVQRLSSLPDVALECAGHGALAGHVVALLAMGVDCIVASVGALADPALRAELRRAAERGSSRITLLHGAIGGIDAIAAARYGGLASVTYVGRKPPNRWLGTPAERVCNLHDLRVPTVVYEGPADEATLLFPKNANVAATVALAGVGFKDTKVCLIADPSVDSNVHQIVARGAFGEMTVEMSGKSLPGNPKTSALTVLSAIGALRSKVSVFEL